MKNFNLGRITAKINLADRDAFLEMYRFYAPKLFRHAYYRINGKEAAEDLVQQVFYKVWQQILGQNKINNLNAFLYRITNNLIVDYYRKSERKDLAIDNEIERTLRVDPSTDNDLENDLDLIKVKKALNRLKNDQRKIIFWRYLDDLSINEIAKLSGQSKGNVYVLIHRAIKELKKIIK